MSHPTTLELERLLAGDGTLPAHAAAHVRGCSACRERLDLLSALGAARGEYAAAQPRPSLRAEVLRAAGETRQTQGHVRQTGHRPPLKVAAAIAALLIGFVPIALFLDGGEAMGASSEVTFVPAEPARGDLVRVEYRPAGLLDGALLLRARLRTEGDGRTYTDIDGAVLTHLTEDENGVFRGAFTLPDSVVYLAAAVETADGAHTDTNFGQLWELLAHEDGKPAAAALMQKVEDHLIRNWQVALSTSRELTRTYPHFAPGWRARFSREKSVTPEAALDSLRDSHRTNLAALSEHWMVAERVDAVTAFEIAFYAEIVGDTGTMGVWKRRLYAEHPAHPLAQEFLTVDAVHAHIATPRDMLAAVDSLWDEAGGAGHQSLAWEGIHAAQRAADGAAAVRWAARYAAIPPERARYGTYPGSNTRYIASVLAGMNDPAAQQLAAGWMRKDLEGLDVVIPRMPGTTAEERAVQLDNARRARLLVLADAHEGIGEPDAARLTRLEAAELGWGVTLFRELAGALEDSAAARYAARWAVDPETSAATSDSLARVFTPRLADGRWTALLESARTRMREEVAREIVNRPLRGEAVFTTSDGSDRPLRELLSGDVTLVAVWSRWCEPSLQQLDRLEQVVALFERRSFGALTIADEAPSPELAAFVDTRGLDFPILHDTRRIAQQALGQWGTPHYLLLDRQGAVRYESRSPSGLLRAAEVLAHWQRTASAASPPARPGGDAITTPQAIVFADTVAETVSAYDAGPVLLNPSAVRTAARNESGKPRALRFQVVVSRAGRVLSAVPLDVTPADVPDRFVRALRVMEFSPALFQGEAIGAQLALTVVL